MLTGKAFYISALSKVLPVKGFKELLFKLVNNDALQAKIDFTEIKILPIKHAILIF